MSQRQSLINTNPMEDDKRRRRHSHRRGHRRKGHSHGDFTSIIKSVALIALFAAFVAGALWVSVALTKVAKHRRRMREEDYVMPKTIDGVKPRLVRSIDVLSLKAGDLIFSQVKPIGQQPFLGWMKDAPFMIKANVANIAAALTKPFAPTHVAVIISTHVSDIRQVKLLDFNGKRTRVWSLADFLTRRGMGVWRLWLARLNVTIPLMAVNALASMLHDDDHPIALSKTKRFFGVKEIGYMLNRSQDIGVVRLEKGMQLVPAEGVIAHGQSNRNTLIRSPGFPLNGYLQTTLSSTVGWIGLEEPIHTCSSFVYAVMEYCGLVLPFYGSGPVVALPTEESLMTDDDESSRTLRLIRHPRELLPHDFLRRDFQWSVGIGVNRVDELDPFAIADNQIYIVPAQ